MDLVPEIPLVVPNSVEALEKTKDAIQLLKDIGAYKDVEKVKRSKRVRAGKGKRRNRRYMVRKGPLLVISKKCEAQRAFRNLPGVDINYVTSMNLLRLAPGGHMGRLIVWTEDAFRKLDKVLKVTTITALPDSKRVINSEEVQSVIRPKKRNHRAAPKNKSRPRLNPAFPIERKTQTRLYLRRVEINKNPRLRRQKVKAKKAEKRLWLKKVSGKVDRKGKPRVPHRTPKTSTKKKGGKKNKKQGAKAASP